jgi:hypothetical protein
MNLHFDIAEVLDMTDIASIETVAARAEDFAEGEWSDDYSYSLVALAAAYRDEVVSQADLIYAGNVLSRYTSLLKLAGVDY